MKRIIQLAIYTLLFCSTIASAEEKPIDNFRVSLGGYIITTYESTVSLTEPNLGAGISISPEDTLGLDTRQTVFRLDGYYRFNKSHGLTYSWFQISSNGSKTLDEEFEWTDRDGNTITIPVGAQIDSVLRYDIYKLGYLWSFYHSKKVELSVGAGLHITKLGLDINASTTSSGLDATDVKVTAPLPVLSLALTYNVTPKFSWYLKSELFSLSFDEYDGTYTDGSAGLEYRIWKNVGLGLGVSSNSLDLTQTTGDYKLKYSNRITGIQAYLAAYF